MGADYIPERDYKAASWMKWFARGLVEQPARYRTTSERAAEIEALVLAFRIAQAKAWADATRTRSAIAARNTARKAAERLVRPEAQRIRTDPQIEPQDKVNIGLNPRGKRRRHIAAPESTPRLMVDAERSGVLRVRVSDSASNKRARPRAAIGMELYERIRPCAVVEAAPRDEAQAAQDAARGAQDAARGAQDAARGAGGPAAMEPGASDAAANEVAPQWRFLGLFTSGVVSVWPSSREPGDEVSLMARWVTRRGEVGPWGGVQSTRVPFGVSPRMGGLTQRGQRTAA